MNSLTGKYPAMAFWLQIRHTFECIYQMVSILQWDIGLQLRFDIQQWYIGLQNAKTHTYECIHQTVSIKQWHTALQTRQLDCFLLIDYNGKTGLEKLV